MMVPLYDGLDRYKGPDKWCTRFVTAFFSFVSENICGALMSSDKYTHVLCVLCEK